MLNNQAQLHRIQKIKPAATFWSLALLAIILLVGCGVQEDQPVNSETPIRLIDLDVTTGQTIYVPAYSEMNIVLDRTLDLAVTLIIHNTDFDNPIFLTSVRYYDTQGQLLREYLTEPRQLGPLASTDFFVEPDEQSGGLGTNFIVEWVAEQPVFEPIVEAIMLNTSNNQGISLTTPGRVIKQITPTDEQTE
jgi:hypothetical protein